MKTESGNGQFTEVLMHMAMMKAMYMEIGTYSNSAYHILATTWRK